MMVKRQYVYGVILVSVLGLIGLFFYDAGKPPHDDVGVSQVRSPDPSSEQASGKSTERALSEQQLEDEFLSEDLVGQIDNFVDYYESQARYPVFSIPIADPLSLEIQQPFEQTEVETPLFDEDGSALPLSLKAAVNKFEYVIGEPIVLKVRVSGLEENQTVTARAEFKKLGAQAISPHAIDLSQVGDDTSQLAATFDTNAFKTEFGLGDVIAGVTVSVDGDSYYTTVPLRLSKTVSARLDNLGVARVQGAFLEIPLQFSVAQGGYFFVQAYLFDETSNRPLLSLQSEGKMQQGNDQLNLRAHFHALKDSGSAGPYSLKVYRAFRSAKASVGEMNDVPIAISAPSYSVPSFAFEDYSDLAYVDPETQRRIEALRELSGE